MSYMSKTKKASCDKLTLYGRCGRKPYQRVYYMVEKNGIMAASLKPSFCLCHFHYCIDKIKTIIFRRHRYYLKIDDDKNEKLETDFIIS